MTKRFLLLLLFVAASASAQIDPLRSMSGTSATPAVSPWVTSTSGGWTVFHGFSAHITRTSESGPAQQRNETFSTNWFAAGAQKNFSDRAFVLARGRVSLEPYTISKDAGYPQMLQYVSAEAGGEPTTDRMRAQDLVGEAALDMGYRPSTSTLLHLYVAAVGDPAVGAPPAQLRSSGVDFAEAPFSYDIAETTHDSTRVVTAGFSSRWITLEGSVFHDAVTTGQHTTIDDGNIDSNAMRVTLTPTQNMAIQVSRAKLGDQPGRRTLTTASITYGSNALAVTGLWARREREVGETEGAYGFELAARGTRNTFMARAEWVDRPFGFPDVTSLLTVKRTTHFTAGYILDFTSASRFRTGIGVNVDYHTQYRDLPSRYGHKPQTVYAFVRLRAGGA